MNHDKFPNDHGGYEPPFESVRPRRVEKRRLKTPVI